MAFLVSPVLPDQDTMAAAMAPVLLQDMARIFRELGVQYLRASVVEMSSKDFLAAWSISDHGEVTDGPAERGLDSVFPGAASTIDELSHAATEETRAHKLSPRRWAFAWRLDEHNAVIAEAHYRDRHDSVGEIDRALVRLVCSTSISASQAGAAAAPAPPGTQALVWPQIDRRARAKVPRTTLLSLGLALIAVLLAGWLALLALPPARDALHAQRAELDQARKMSDGTLAQGLSQALATGDYGEAQTALSAYAGLGYFKAAVVTNPNGRIVAIAGPLERLRIGDAVTPEFAAGARTLALALGSERYGQLLLAGPGTAAGTGVDADADALFAIGLLVLSAVGLSAGVLAWQFGRERV